jgi:transcriptional regulator with XRE-family HTH domain
MSNLYENIKELCDEKGVKPGKMCTEASVSKGLITDLKMGRKKTVHVETAQKIADYFGVTVDRVLGAEKAPATEGEGIKYTDFELLQAYHDADARTKEAIRTLLGIKGD